jgi:PIN domain nuclease of toxin-antitoxin system
MKTTAADQFQAQCLKVMDQLNLTREPVVTEPQRVSRPAASAIGKGRLGGGWGIAAITLGEIARLFSRGTLRAPGTVEDSIQALLDSSGVTVHSWTPTIAALATQFPEDYRRDPADRLIGAAARAEGIALSRRDEQIRKSKFLKTIW